MEPFEGPQEIALSWERLINAKEVAVSEQATRVEVSRCLVELWVRMAEMEANANLLQAELFYTHNDQQGVSAAKEKASRDDSRSLPVARLEALLNFLEEHACKAIVQV